MERNTRISDRRARWLSGAAFAMLFRAFDDEELVQRDKVSLDILWLKDESLEDIENLPAPKVLAQDTAESPAHQRTSRR